MVQKCMYIFWPFIVFYVISVAIYANFSVIDDHTLTHTLLANNFIPFFIHINIGRFYPLDGQDLNILSFLFAPNATIFYAFNALCVILIVLLLVKTLCNFHVAVLQSFYPKVLDSNINATSSRNNAYLCACLCLGILLLSPAFIQSFLRLFVPERMGFVFLVAFLASYIVIFIQSIFKTTQNELLHKILLCIGILCANVSLYYKETLFAMLGTFAFLHFIFRYLIAKTTLHKHKLTSLSLFDIALMLSSTLWLVIYYIVMLQKTSSDRYGGNYLWESPKIFSSIFSTFWKITLNEPFLILGILAGLILCIKQIVIAYRTKNADIHKLYCIAIMLSMIGACWNFIIEYIVLGIFPANHYMLPAYIFALPILCVVLFFAIQSKNIKICFGIVGIYYISSVLPNSSMLFLHYKFVPNNFQSCLSFLSQYIKEHPHTRFYLERINRASGVEYYDSFALWLTYYGAKDFDMLSDTKIDNERLGKPRIHSPYTVFQNNDIVPKQKGDIIVLPCSNKFIAQTFMEDSRYELLYQSPYNIDIPNMSLRNAIRYLKYKFQKLSSHAEINVGQYSDFNFYIFKVL